MQYIFLWLDRILNKDEKDKRIYDTGVVIIFLAILKIRDAW